MNAKVREAIFQATNKEPFARVLKMELVTLEDGHAVVNMVYDPEKMDNIYNRLHGGAIFGLIDEAFETASQTDGTIAVALNVNVTYVSSPEAGLKLQAESHRLSQTEKTASYEIKVTDQEGRLVAVCQALAFRTNKPIPFL
jgi:acyl-CoA thioesterase